MLSFLLIPDTTKFNLAEEDEKWRQYLLQHGWNGLMGDGSVAEHRAADFATIHYELSHDNESTEEPINHKI